MARPPHFDLLAVSPIAYIAFIIVLATVAYAMYKAVQAAMSAKSLSAKIVIYCITAFGAAMGIGAIIIFTTAIIHFAIYKTPLE